MNFIGTIDTFRVYSSILWQFDLNLLTFSFCWSCHFSPIFSLYSLERSHSIVLRRLTAFPMLRLTEAQSPKSLTFLRTLTYESLVEDKLSYRRYSMVRCDSATFWPTNSSQVTTSNYNLCTWSHLHWSDVPHLLLGQDSHLLHIIILFCGKVFS